MATNWPQLVKPRACRSALCCVTAFSKLPRENNCNTCEKMLHTFIRLSLLWLNWFFDGTQSSLSEDSASYPRREPRKRPVLSLRIWTAVERYRRLNPIQWDSRSRLGDQTDPYNVRMS